MHYKKITKLKLLIFTLLLLLFSSFFGYPGGLLKVSRLQAQTNPVDSLQPGQWFEVPNSNLSAVIPNPAPVGSTGRTSAIIDAWSGGAYDTKRDRLIVWGGGHADYGGNEIYTFDVNTLRWSRPWGPSMNPPPEAVCSETYPDGNPPSKHTYDGELYIPSVDRFWAFGGSVWYCGSASLGTWTFDFNTLSWTRRQDGPGIFLGVMSAYDPVTQHVFAQSLVAFAEYDPVSNTWTVRGDQPGSLSENPVRTAAIDPVNRLFVAIGEGEFFVWDLKTWRLSHPTMTGGAAMLNARAPGLEYDPVSKKIIGWPGGTSVYSLDTSTWTWTRIDPASTNTVTPTLPTATGTFGRFRYIPSKNAFIVVNGINENVFVYKLTSGGGTTPPSAPTGLTITAIPSSQIKLSWNASTANVAVARIPCVPEHQATTATSSGRTSRGTCGIWASPIARSRRAARRRTGRSSGAIARTRRSSTA